MQKFDFRPDSDFRVLTSVVPSFDVCYVQPIGEYQVFFVFFGQIVQKIVRKVGDLVLLVGVIKEVLHTKKPEELNTNCIWAIMNLFWVQLFRSVEQIVYRREPFPVFHNFARLNGSHVDDLAEIQRVGSSNPRFIVNLQQT